MALELDIYHQKPFKYHKFMYLNSKNTWILGTSILKIPGFQVPLKNLECDPVSRVNSG